MNFSAKNVRRFCNRIYAETPHAVSSVEQLRPRVLVSYVREPYVYAAGNVRVTFDSHIRTSLFQRKFSDGALPDICATDAPGDVIL